MIDYVIVLSEFYANNKWVMNGHDYDGLIWLDDTKQPTQKELNDLYPQAVYLQQCRLVETQRLSDYEKQSDPVFFKWQRGDATEAEWREAVAKVKLENPYPPAP